MDKTKKKKEKKEKEKRKETQPGSWACATQLVP